MAAVRCVGPYELRETLGSGLQGKVKLAVNTATGERVALKLISKERMTEDSREWRNLQREIAAMSRVAHPNIVCLREFSVSAQYPRRNGTTREVIALALDLASGGEVFDFLSYTGAFSEPLARHYFQQLVGGLRACHDAGIAHRDLKPENLLFDSAYNLKIADFGLSAVRDAVAAPGAAAPTASVASPAVASPAASASASAPPSGLRTQCGTVGYMAPEVRRGAAYDGAAADIWSCGVILFIMLAGFPPFQSADPSDWWFQRVLSNQYSLFWQAHLRSARFSQSAMDLLSRIFTADPARRLTLAGIFDHPWVKEASPLPDGFLAGEMARRKAAVELEKARERERQRREREEEKRRAGVAVSYSVAVARGEDEPQPPALPDFAVPHVNVTYLESVPPSAVMERLVDALEVLGAKAQPKLAEHRVKAALGDAAVAISLYTAPGGKLVLDFVRRSGTYTEVAALISDVCAKIADIIAVDSASASAAPEAPPSAAPAEEEELAPEVF